MATREVISAVGHRRRAFASLVCIALLIFSNLVVAAAQSPPAACTEDTEGADCATGEQCVCSSSNLDGDPHLELVGPDGKKLTWDFHGSGNQSYCMVTDKYIALNTHMFTIPLDVKVIKQEVPKVEPFFEGTWVDGLGIVYKTQDNKNASIEIILDQKRARANSQPITVRFRNSEGDSVQVLSDASNWTSPDGVMTISQDGKAAYIIIPELLTMAVKVEPEGELITEPPIHCLNFEIKTLRNTANVHGFLGQMHAPGAIAKRLQMGTLEGLMHREYVEGTDDDYATSGLTATDCSFDRFGMDGAQLVQSRMSLNVTSSIKNWEINPGRRLLQMPDTGSGKPNAHFQRRDLLATECKCVSKSCSNATTCKATQICCGGLCAAPITLTVPTCGFIAVYPRDSTAPTDLLGYVTPVWNSYGEYVDSFTVIPALPNALEVRFDPDNKYSAVAVNGPNSARFPYIGAVEGYADASDDFGVGSYNYAYLGGTTGPADTPSPARAGDNSFTAASNIPESFQDAIWSVGGCGALDTQWVNTDGSLPATHAMLLPGCCIILTGDEQAFQNFAFGNAQSVRFEFVPATGGCST